MNRFILHCDLDCFFASVEERDNPEYIGKPIIIGADPKDGKGRGVVSTCNYDARKFGLHSAMPISQAYKRCPHGIYLHPNFEKYQRASKEVMEIVNSYSDKFQQVSIDEAYLDLSDICTDFNDVKELAIKLKDEVQKNVGITISVGCAPTKSIAKIASDYNKPNGITIVEPNQIKDFLKNLDITRIPGIGKKSKLYYNKKGIKIIGDIINLTLPKMIQLFGKNGEWVWNVSNGFDTREVKEFHGDRKSISKERTFYEDTDDLNVILSKLEEINNRIHKNLIKNKIYYKTVTLKIRLEGFITYTRSKSFIHHVQDKNQVIKVIIELLNQFSTMNKKVRLVGIRLSNLEKAPSVAQTTILSYLEA
ncbi:MAG: DNA polymerase IV [Candidatus Lokiarchaeota archaeon]|nr:DNA polymerase IV [Candidatus Lokiarchaeota archaeon]